MSELKVNMMSWFKIHVLGRNLDQVYVSQNFIKEGYSLLPFEKTKSIFVHIPKAAGVSVNKGLYGSLGGGHNNLEDYNRIFGKKNLKKYFKYTFVRHPVSRAYSAFRFLKSGGLRETDRLWADKYLSQYNSFDDFVQDWICEENIWKGIHFRPQWHFICDPFPKIAVDFVGKFETLDEDMNYILEKTGIAHGPLTHENKTVNSHNHLEDAAPESVLKIKKVYAHDFELFGYE